MNEKTAEQLDAWRLEALSQWTDERIVDASWVDVHIWFFLHAYADLAEMSLELYGVTFRENYAGWLMVVKVRQGDVPLVAFLSGKTPTGCMRHLRNQLREGNLNLSRDKYG